MTTENFELSLPFVSPPVWAPTWCYLYYVVGILNFLFGLIFVFMFYDKMRLISILVFMSAISMGFINTLMYFWICRGSLNK